MNTAEQLQTPLAEYLEHLTDSNWHTLRLLIELERNTLPNHRNPGEILSAYGRARDYLLAAHRAEQNPESNLASRYLPAYWKQATIETEDLATAHARLVSEQVSAVNLALALDLLSQYAKH